MITSRIHIAPPCRRDGAVRLEGELQLPAGGCHRVFFEFTTPDDLPDRPRVRPFLLAFLLPAMHAGAPLELDLPVDAVTHGNLMEWQEAMASWSPQTLNVVPIRAPLEAEPEKPRAASALTAFSGGVDSNFSVWRHGRRRETPLFRTTPLCAGMMVHGFDIPLTQETVFERAWERSLAMLEASGLRAFRLATNLRSLDRLPGCEWSRQAHGIWLAAALSCFEPWFGQMLIPSSFPYPALMLPWASNPATDGLFSSAASTFWHDGAAHSKLAKIRAIVGEPAVLRYLRVCWKGEQLDRNCGKCFKCVATQICFKLAGVERLDAFPEPCTPADAARVPVEHEANVWLVRLLSAEALRQGHDAIARALEHALARARTQKRKWRIRQFIRQWPRRLIR